MINDLVTDSRVSKTCNALLECDYEVVLIGRKLRTSLPMPKLPYRAHRMRMLFTKGPLFYLFFNLRLFFRLLFTKADLFYANDLDTLLPNYLVSKIKNKALIYDSHELFTEVPELQGSRLKRNIWLFLESSLVPKLKTCLTVNESIAKILLQKYGVPFQVIRNIPEDTQNFIPKSRSELGLPADKNIIILQGAGINMDRGAEELIAAMQFVEGSLLLVIGSGDVWETLKSTVRTLDLSKKVLLIDRIPKTELRHYTHNADLGVSIDKPNNPNYYNSLPNKIFDYFQAGLPILASRLPEIEMLVQHYDAGDFISSHEPQIIAETINRLLLSPKRQQYKANALRAGKEQSWVTEKKKLLSAIQSAT